MPSTATALQRSANETSYDQMGFIVTHAAMSKKNGFVPFAKSGKVGVENKGIGNSVCSPGNCINVTVFNLDTYVEKSCR